MARITIVKKANKAQGNCCVCGIEIGAGQPYKWAKPRGMGKVIACAKCTIPNYMLSTSKLAPLWEAQTKIDRLNHPTLPDAMNDLANQAREIGDEYQAAADNQGEVFQGSDNPNEEKAEALGEWADSLETNASEIETKLGEIETLEQEKEKLDQDESDLDMKEELNTEEQEGMDQIVSRIGEIKASLEALHNEIDELAEEIDNCPDF